MVRSFWWGASKGKQKLTGRRGKHMIQPKACGGLGFKDFRFFNQAMFARQAWRILSNPGSLCPQVLKARYFPEGHMEDMVFGSNASQRWQSIVHGLELLKRGLVWRIGNGSSVRIWRDSWIPHPVGRPPIPQQGRCHLQRVSELLNEGVAGLPAAPVFSFGRYS